MTQIWVCNKDERVPLALRARPGRLSALALLTTWPHGGPDVSRAAMRPGCPLWGVLSAVGVVQPP